jgi:hypothetical protein
MDNRLVGVDAALERAPDRSGIEGEVPALGKK